MATIKNQLPTLTTSTVQKFLTVNKIADQLDSGAMFLAVEPILAAVAVPQTNKAYLVNYGANIGKILYYYLDSSDSVVKAVYVPATVGDTLGEYVRGSTNWAFDCVLASGTVLDTTLTSGSNLFRATASWNFSYTGAIYTTLTVANPLVIPAGLVTIFKDGSNYFVSI